MERRVDHVGAELEVELGRAPLQHVGERGQGAVETHRSALPGEAASGVQRLGQGRERQLDVDGGEFRRMPRAPIAVAQRAVVDAHVIEPQVRQTCEPAVAEALTPGVAAGRFGWRVRLREPRGHRPEAREIP